RRQPSAVGGAMLGSRDEHSGHGYAAIDGPASVVAADLAASQDRTRNEQARSERTRLIELDLSIREAKPSASRGEPRLEDRLLRAEQDLVPAIARRPGSQPGQHLLL